MNNSVESTTTKKHVKRLDDHNKIDAVKPSGNGWLLFAFHIVEEEKGWTLLWTWHRKEQVRRPHPYR